MKSLILYGYGICDVNYKTTTTELENISHPNIDQLTQCGSTTKLHLRNPSAHSQQHAQEDSIAEILQLLDLYDQQQQQQQQRDDEDDNEKTTSSSAGTMMSVMAQRYHDMKFKVLSNDKFVVSALSEHESNVQLFLQLNTLANDKSLLENELAQNDVVLIHFNSSSSTQEKAQTIELMDKILGNDFDDDLLRVVIMSYGTIPPNQDQTNQSVTTHQTHKHGLRRPVQSYTVKQTRPVENVRHEFPMYAVMYHNGSTRRDYNTALTEKCCEQFAGNDSILADHFFGELAYKLSLSDKYGA